MASNCLHWRAEIDFPQLQPRIDTAIPTMGLAHQSASQEGSPKSDTIQYSALDGDTERRRQFADPPTRTDSIPTTANEPDEALHIDIEATNSSGPSSLIDINRASVITVSSGVIMIKDESMIEVVRKDVDPHSHGKHDSGNAQLTRDEVFERIREWLKNVPTGHYIEDTEAGTMHWTWD